MKSRGKILLGKSFGEEKEMRLVFRLPMIKPETLEMPEVCPHKGCKGKRFVPFQQVVKALRDTQYREVNVRRYKCLRCGRTFRVYPSGVSREQVSQRLKGLAVMLYLLGLSYGAVALFLQSLGFWLSKTLVYYTVQKAAAKVPGMRREKLIEGVRAAAVGSDVTMVKVKGKWCRLGVVVDAVSGVVLCLDGLAGEDGQTLREWLQPVVEAVGAELLVSDDADAFKQVAEALGLPHQVCKSHVQRNTEQLVEELKALVKGGRDHSLQQIGVSSEQALADLDRLKQLVKERQPEQEQELEKLLERYLGAEPPGAGEKASLAYRLRLLLLDRWNLWKRLTRYRRWQGSKGEQIDGTNNAAERAIGWWIKERYRTMRGYKRETSAVNVSRLLAWCGNHLQKGGAPLACLLA